MDEQSGESEEEEVTGEGIGESETEELVYNYITGIYNYVAGMSTHTNPCGAATT